MRPWWKKNRMGLANNVLSDRFEILSSYAEPMLSQTPPKGRHAQCFAISKILVGNHVEQWSCKCLRTMRPLSVTGCADRLCMDLLDALARSKWLKCNIPNTPCSNYMVEGYRRRRLLEDYARVSSSSGSDRRISCSR